MPAAKTRTVSVRLTEEQRQSLQADADKRGLDLGELGRMYLVEKIKEAEAPHAPVLKLMQSLTALIIASLSETIFIEDAKELVEQHIREQSS